MRRLKAIAAVCSRSWAEWGMLVEACWWLGIARGAIAIVPFRRLAAKLGCAMAESSAADVDVHQVSILRISWAVRVLSRRMPWARQCLVQALAARWMLQRRHIPSTMYFGVAKDDTGRFLAHAWLCSGSQVLTGAQACPQFTVVATFAQTH